MAEGDAHVFNNFKEQLLLGTMDLDTDAFKVALYSDAFAAGDIDGDPTYSVTNEIVASGYTAGGASVGTPVVTQDDTNDWAKWDDDGNDITWSSLATATIQQAILYNDTVSDYLCIAWEIATNSNGGDYKIQFGANGIMTLS